MPKLNEYLRANCGKARDFQIWSLIILFGTVTASVSWIMNDQITAVEIATVRADTKTEIERLRGQHEIRVDAMRETIRQLRTSEEQTRPVLMMGITDLFRYVKSTHAENQIGLANVMEQLAMLADQQQSTNKKAETAAAKADKAAVASGTVAIKADRAAAKSAEAAEQTTKAVEAVQSIVDDINAGSGPAKIERSRRPSPGDWNSGP